MAVDPRGIEDDPFVLTIAAWRSSRARRLAVIRRGRVVAETPAQITSLSLEGRPPRLDSADYRPRET